MGRQVKPRLRHEAIRNTSCSKAREPSKTCSSWIHFKMTPDRLMKCSPPDESNAKLLSCAVPTVVKPVRFPHPGANTGHIFLARQSQNATCAFLFTQGCNSRLVFGVANPSP